MRHFPLLAAVFACGVVAAAQAPPTATQVTPKVTATMVSAPLTVGAGTVTTVATATTSGNNAYNYFSTFNVAAPDTVDLLLPSGTSNLINLVDNQALIWGKVNSLVGGQIGGNLYFADPQGVIVGAGGAIHAGSLTLVTPTPDFLNGFFDGSGNPTGESATLTGAPASVPLSPGGLISVAGAITTNGPVNLIAPTVNVAGSVITGVTTATPNGDPNFDPNFGNLVNTTGLIAGQAITIDGNSITIDGGGSTAKVQALGDNINLNANQVVSLQWIPGLTFFQAPSASAGISIGNAQVWAGGDLNLNAVASTTKLANPAAGQINDQEDGGDFLQNVGYSSTPGDTSLTPLFDNPAFQGLTEVAGVAISKANANISIGQTGASNLRAGGNLNVNSSATSNVEVQTIGLYAGVTYGESDANAVAAIGGNSYLNAGGAVNVEAQINNSLLLTTATASGVKGTPTSTPAPAVALAYGKTDSESSATVAPGATIFGNMVSVEADNANSFESEASGSEYQAATNSSGAGIGIALGFYTSNANASLSGDVITRGYGSTPALTTVGGATVNMGDVNVAANTLNSTNSTESSSSVSDDMNNAGIFSQLPFTSNIAQFASSKNPNAEANANALNLSGAVSYASTSNNANATIANGAEVNAGWEYGQAGNITVNALAQDAPDIAATGSAGGGSAAIGGSVAISNFGNTANASVVGQADAGDGSSSLSVLADATIPNRLTAGPFTALPGQFDNLAFTAPTSADGFQSDWNSIGTLVGDLETALNPNGSDLGEFLNDNGGLNNLLTSFVNTGASANGGSHGNGYGVAGSLNFLNINNTSSATISGMANATGLLTVEADADPSLINWVGTGAAIGPLKEHNIGVTGDGSLGGAYNGVNLTNSAVAAVDDSATIQAGNININSNTNEFLVNVAQAGDDSKKFGITGAFDWVAVNNTSLAYIQTDARVNAGGGSVDLNASNTLNDFTIGGALGYGGNAQVGASVAWNQFTNTTEAYIGDPGNTRAQGSGYVNALNLNLNANANESLWAISLAATKASGSSESNESGTGASDSTEGSNQDSFEGTDSNNNPQEAKYGFGASGNVIINDMTDTTEAFLNNGAQTSVLGAVNLNANDTSWDLAGGLAASLVTGGKDNALAGAFSRNDLSKTTEAIITNANVAGVYGNPISALSLDATSTGDVLTIAGGGAIAGSGNSLAGSVANNPIRNTTEAGLGAGASVDARQDVSINAATNDKVISVAGALSGGGNDALGAALDYSQYGNTTLAFIDDGDNVSAGGNITVVASNNQNLLPIAASLAVGGNGGLSGSADQEGVTNTTQATLGDATIAADGNLLLGANDDTALQQIVGSAALSGGPAVGLSGAISTSGSPLIQRETDARIAANANVTAWGSDSDPIAFDGQNVIGLELNAANTGGVESFVAGGAIAGSISVAAELILNYISEDANAVIGNGAQINTNDAASADWDQAVTVAASDDTSVFGVTGALSAAGTAAIGAAADTETLTRNVYAVIGAGSSVQAAGNVLDDATLTGNLTSYAVAGGFSGSVAADGAASVLSAYDTTKAEVDGNVMAGGSIGVAANRNTSVSANEGGLSLALDASLAVAYASVTTNENVIAGVGDGAQLSAGGNATVPTFNANGSGPSAGSLTGISVTAITNGGVTDYSVGGAIGGFLGATGSGILNRLSDSTTAEAGNNASLDGAAVNVLASDATLISDAAGAAAAGAIGIGAAGDGLPSDPNSLTKNTLAELGGTVVNAPHSLTVQALSTENLTSYTGAAGAGFAGAAGALANYTISPITQALIEQCSACSGTQLSAGSLTQAATDTIGGKQLAGGFAIGAVGFGGALIQGTVDATTMAAFGNGVTLTTPGAVAIDATLNDNLKATAYAAAGGVIGIGGAASELNDNSTTSASIGGDASIQGASAVNLNVQSRRTLDATSLGAAIGGVAGGLSEDTAQFRGGSAATIGSGAQIGSAGAPVGSFALNLFDYTNASPTATALAGGVVSGVGAETDATVFSFSNENVGNQAAIYTSGNLDLNAQINSTAYSTVNTEQIGALNAGSADAEVNTSPNAVFNIGAANLVAGGQLQVTLGTLNEAQADADSAASSSFVSGNYTQANAYDSPYTALTIAPGSNLDASGAVLIESTSNNGSYATANGQAGSFSVAAQGATDSYASSAADTLLTENGGVTSTGNNITIEAVGGGQADANSTGGSGGGIYTGATTSAQSSVDPTTTAALESGAHITALNGAINFLASGSGQGIANANESGDSSIIPTSLVSLLEGDALINSTDNINANVLGATLNAQTVNLTAQASEYIMDANSFVQNGGDGDARAYSNIQASLRPALTLANANITGSAAVNLLATTNPYYQDVVFTSAWTTATNSACDFCAGVVHSDSYDNFDISAVINAGPGAVQNSLPWDVMQGLPGTPGFGHITSPALNAQVVMPINYNNGESIWGNEFTDASGTGLTSQDESGPGSADGGSTFVNGLRWLSLEGTVQGAPAAPVSLLVAADGSYTGNLPVVATDPNDLVLGAVTGTTGGSPALNFSVGGGPGSVADSISSYDYGGWENLINSNGVQTELGTEPTVTITNNSPLNLIVGAITAQNVNISGNSTGDVVLNGALFEPQGAVNITDQGGSIYATSAGSIYANQIALNAVQGNLGGAGSLACPACGGALTVGAIHSTFFNDGSTPTVSLIAGGNLDVTGAVLENSPAPPASGLTLPVTISNLTAGGNLSLNLTEGLMDFSGQGDFLEISAYAFPNGATAGGSLTIAATSYFYGLVRYAFDGTVQSGGNMDIYGSAFLQPANLTVTGAGSSISAFTLSDDLDLTVQTAGGVVNAGTDGGNVNITQPSGDLNAGEITASACLFGCGYGNVSLTANSGSIDDGMNGTVTNVIANNLTLNAPNGAIGGGVFTDANASPLRVQTTGTVNTTALFDVNLTEVSGNLNFGTIGGNEAFGTIIDLTAETGSINGGQIETLGDISLNAPQGSITIPQIYSYITHLSASALGDITLNDGNSVAAGNISSQSGNVTINVGGQLAGGGTISGQNITLNATGIGGSEYITTNGPAYTPALASPVTIAAGGTLTANAPGDINLAQAGGSLNIASVTAGGTAQLLAQGGAILNAAAPGTAAVTASDVVLEGGSVGTSGDPLAVDTITRLDTTTTGDINVLGTGTLLIGNVTSSGGAVNLAAAGGSLNSLVGGTGTISAGGSADLSAPTGSIGGTSMLQVLVGAGGMLNANAGNGITLTTPSGNLPLGSLSAGGEINLDSENGSILAATPGINLIAGRINLLAANAVGSTAAKITGRAGGTWNVTAGTGMFLTSDGTFNALALDAPNVQLTVNGGAATISNLTAGSANLALTAAGAALTIGNATITNLLRASADVENLANIVNPSPTQPLYLSLVGANNHEATSIVAEAVSQAPVIVETYSSQNGSIRDAGDWLMVEHVGIGQAATFANDWESVLVTNPGTSLAYFTGDFVGNELKMLNGTLQAAATALQPNQTYTLPGALTSYEKWMVNELAILP